MKPCIDSLNGKFLNASSIVRILSDFKRESEIEKVEKNLFLKKKLKNFQKYTAYLNI